MNVRSASFRDLGRIDQLWREATTREESGLTSFAGDSPVPQTILVRLWHAVSKTLSSLVPTAEPDTALLVAEDTDGSIVGFIQAQGVSGQPKAWHVVNLCLAATGRGHFAGAPLITHLCNEGLSRRVTRFSVRIPVDHTAVNLFLEQGFTQYATEQILFRDDSADTPRVVAPGDGARPLRPARREDIGGIYHLYLRTTPSHVANLEGPSQKAWQASFQQGCMARLGRDDMRHFVAERAGIVAWAALRPASAARPAVLALMCEGQDAGFREEVIEAALAHAQPGPVACVLRHYDSELIRALQRRGFEIYGTQLLLVRDLALKVRIHAPVRDKKKVALAHAGLARSAAGPVNRPLHVLPTTPTRRSTSSSPR
ncbi:MAG TPA: hypothetical protein VG266_02240 [Candidatus Dormibacteraeota bacterium]|jgi:L-amino acid N-acyltransferase YncA|nr:hypothetical protein [Candidatus Dormibacteraeota bacterium]